jgi:hypothetical protein
VVNAIFAHLRPEHQIQYSTLFVQRGLNLARSAAQYHILAPWWLQSCLVRLTSKVCPYEFQFPFLLLRTVCRRVTHKICKHSISDLYVCRMVYIICRSMSPLFFVEISTFMNSVLPVIEVVIFRANQECLDDPALFKEVRDIVVATTRCV